MSYKHELIHNIYSLPAERMLFFCTLSNLSLNLPLKELVNDKESNVYGNLFVNMFQFVYTSAEVCV